MSQHVLYGGIDIYATYFFVWDTNTVFFVEKHSNCACNVVIQKIVSSPSFEVEVEAVQ